jgi:heme/copper-type cytochrome/quinol oxidase subunit 2
MTIGGWVIMTVSVGFVTGLLVWCAWRVTRETSPRKIHSQLDIEPRDIEE